MKLPILKAASLNELPIGMRVYTFGAFGSESIYCITGPMTKRGQEMCLISRWNPNAYFASPKDYFDTWYRAVKANIVAELKHHFPNHKFSVNKDGDSSIRISWYDGLVSEKVDDVVRKFESHKSDVTAGYWDFSPSCFNTVFGGMKFVFINRHMSDEVMKLTKQVEEILSDRYKAVDQQLLREYWSETGFPFNATNISVVANPDAKAIDDLFSFQYDVPEKLISVASPEGIKVVEYLQSFAVIGDTKPLKDKLKALGGQFNFRLTCGAGWIFPNTLKENVLEALQL